MNKLILFAGFIGVALISDAQIVNVKKTFGNAVVNQTNSSIYNAESQGVNAIFSAPGKIFRKIKSNKQNSSTNPSVISDPGNVNVPVNNTQVTNTSSPDIIKSGNTDFVTGTDVLLSDNFSSTKPGDFPSNWLTNSSGEARTIDGQPGQWLQISANGIFALDQPNDLPENFRLEYDAIFHPTTSKVVHNIFYFNLQKNQMV